MGLENFRFFSGDGSDSMALLLVSLDLFDFIRVEESSRSAELENKKILCCNLQSTPPYYIFNECRVSDW